MHAHPPRHANRCNHDGAHLGANGLQRTISMADVAVVAGVAGDNDTTLMV